MIRFGNASGHSSTRISFFTFTKEHIILCTFPLSYEPLFTSRGTKNITKYKYTYHAFV